MAPSMMNRCSTALLTIVALLLSLVSPVAAGEIHLSVAASLREAVNELADRYAAEHPGLKFIRNFGSSGALAKQIENGAPADLFFSANADWMEYLKRQKLLDNGSVFPFAYNTLVFVGRDGLRAGTLAEVAKLEQVAIGSPKSVPAGAYAAEALSNAGLLGQMAGKLVMARDVRECLLYADRGEVDGAFVYRTDALQAARNAKILFTVPQRFYSRVACPMALTAPGARKDEAKGFLDFLKSGEAKKVLIKHGFAVE